MTAIPRFAPLPIAITGWAAVALLVAACASAPVASAEGEEDLSVTAFVQVQAVDPVTGNPIPATFDREPVSDVKCTFRNDKGVWSAVTPATIRVRRSWKPLEAECAKEGFAPAHWKSECVSPQQALESREPPGLMALYVLAIPIGIAGIPFGGGGVAVQGLLGVGEHAYTATKPGACSYGPILVPLVR